MQNEVTAPGKVLWIGSYSVVFGGISHVIAINRRVRCRCEESQRLEFITSYGNFLEGQNELIDSVLEEVRRVYEIPPLRVYLINDPEFQIDGKKTGLGSSSAGTVALTGCLIYTLEGKLDVDLVYRLSQRANYRRQKGIGSGFDIAAATFGSVVYRRYNDINKVDSTIKKLQIPDNLQILLGFTGRSANTVNLVRRFEEAKENQRFKEVMHEIEIDNEMAIKLLELGKVDAAIPHIKLARRNLNLLSKQVVGVELETEEDRKLMALAEKNGALISLMPGAGGGDLIMALGENLEKVREAWQKMSIRTIDVKQDEGVRVETGS
ncbi:Phosphomevalonate kinase [Metallosphaera sp. J1]|uniref:phosphomevalonate kinase n=1 Tax=Metallosphaera javensis (ex Hofmann et al. 2022) TaxID=99938 RepID=UPI001EDDF62D|nr:phosphomevalonate kinase [Metallosphaera javensis (ex Hofmann et al. 2022)]MCG3108083.1 Phosphomevalonate kinase [Metallosphaera javensis (ex Hofmann et al. 2022)]